MKSFLSTGGVTPYSLVDFYRRSKERTGSIDKCPRMCQARNKWLAPRWLFPWVISSTMKMEAFCLRNVGAILDCTALHYKDSTP
jgi:hypothetical protein